jgi:DNA-binding transcriptional ArsR family regulator
MTSTAAKRADDRLDRVFGALSDRTRRAMVQRLSRASATVSELAEPFDMTLPAVSKHLRVLENAGLVARRVDGRVHHCSLRPEALSDAASFIDHYRVFWETALEALAIYVETDDAQ